MKIYKLHKLCKYKKKKEEERKEDEREEEEREEEEREDDEEEVEEEKEVDSLYTVFLELYYIGLKNKLVQL